MKKRMIYLVVCVVLAAISIGVSQTKKKWPPRSMDRPRPEVITPADIDKPGAPPSDAIVLFDGTNFDEWEMVDRNSKAVVAPKWKIENGYMEIVAKTGSIQSKQKFGDCQIHVEWAAPSVVVGSSQGRGNSGFFLLGKFEIQVLDSYDNITYADGQAGALYSKYPPLVNACRKPGEWQIYDIIYNLPKDGKPGMLTVLHNGIAIHHAVNPGGNNEEFQIGLQDHNNPVRYRNIWVRKLNDYPQ